MTRLAWMMVTSMLTLSGISSPGLSDDAERPTGSKKNPDLHEGMTVKWVFEGCAAYPVLVDEPVDEPVEPLSATRPPASS